MQNYKLKKINIKKTKRKDVITLSKKSMTLEEILEKKKKQEQKAEKKLYSAKVPSEKPKKTKKDKTETKETKKEETNTKDNKKQRKPSPRRISTQSLAMNLAIKVAVILLIVWLALTFVIAITINYGNNMHPAINDGELVVSLRLQSPYLNAAVLYKHDGKTRVGRVVGLPGNTVEITENGELKVNGVVAAEDIYYPTFPSENSDIKYPLTVPEGKVFILNDYREDTNDSRTFGLIDIKDTKGPIIFSFRRRGF